jgi:hypothetical protein
VSFLLRKFEIENPDDAVETDFGKYIRYKKPEMRGRKPFLNGKTWKVQYDPWRSICRTSFGLDYLKDYPKQDDDYWDGNGMRQVNNPEQLMTLYALNENDEPVGVHDVLAQRVSCYIQRRLKASEIPGVDDDLAKPYLEGDVINRKLKDKDEYIPRLRALDNSDVIIIFDNSYSGNIEDTLIAARKTWESRWRRLPFHLALESRESIANDDELSLQCAKTILNDVFMAVVAMWDSLLDRAVTHVGILEDKLYEQPADETRAPELWQTSSFWVKVEKLLNIHTDIMNEMKVRLHELSEEVDSEDNWLEDIPGNLHRLGNLVTEDLVKPTESLISLLYQSVAIRDSRHSLQLGVSMWRLSWITFIFLPLTFIVGFFGMSVDTFVNHPSIKWYFISAVPFMLGVVTIYFLMKRSAAAQQQTLRKHNVYESFIQEMASSYPALWSRAGPRNYVPRGPVARLKWTLIRSWSWSKWKAHIVGEHTGDAPDLLSKFRCYLGRRWTAQIQRSMISDTELQDLEGHIREDPINLGLIEVAEVLGAPASPTAVRPSDPSRLSVPWSQTRTEGDPTITAATIRRSDDSGGRSSSAGRNSEILIEEEDAERLHQRAREEAG